jgi:hypothetical protein
VVTKLHVPRARPGFVPRPRLADRLEEGLARGLVSPLQPIHAGTAAPRAGPAALPCQRAVPRRFHPHGTFG